MWEEIVGGKMLWMRCDAREWLVGDDDDATRTAETVAAIHVF